MSCRSSFQLARTSHSNWGMLSLLTIKILIDAHAAYPALVSCMPRPHPQTNPASTLIKAHRLMEEVGSNWTLKAKQLSQLLRGTRSDETHIVELLEQLSEFSYPIQGLAIQVCFIALCATASD